MLQGMTHKDDVCSLSGYFRVRPISYHIFMYKMIQYPLCPLGGSCHNCKQIHVFKDPKVCDDFCQWAMDPIWRRYNTTFIAHNAAGYDT